ncbi:hypothetical protein [Streptomyces shenzhenensis]|uniref:hypothetical protein n=1 Tax=Streptomyces shenzhenensis TaxID=943815 RepID=UPI001F1D796D|nr:hypothetical protein [Streptomyces shenzhenensis]
MKRTTIARHSTSRLETAPAETSHERVPDTDAVTCRAAGLYAACVGYETALKAPGAANTLDRMAETAAEILPDLVKVVNARGGAEFAEALLAATVAPLMAFAAIEHARAEAASADVGYLFDLLADRVKAGVDPRMIRRDALAAPARIRELAEAARA